MNEEKITKKNTREGKYIIDNDKNLDKEMCG